MCSMQPDCAGSNITVLHFARHATWVYRTGDMRLELALKTSHDLLCSSQGKMRSYVRRWPASGSGISTCTLYSGGIHEERKAVEGR